MTSTTSSFSPSDFASLSLPPHVLANLTQLGYLSMTPIQAASLPPASGGTGPENTVSPEEFNRRVKQWQELLVDHGWAGITWPKAYGGRGGTSLQSSIFTQESSRFGVATTTFAVGIGMALHMYADDHGGRVPPVRENCNTDLREHWCQLPVELAEGRYLPHSDLGGREANLEDPFDVGHTYKYAAPEPLILNGEPAGEGLGSAVQGHPAEAVAWLANTLGAFGIPFRAGELILSGSLAPLVPARAGDRFEMEIAGLGSCSIAFS